MLVGSRKAIGQARIHRKALGGGMRQAGVLAAAGLIALHEMPKRLAEDHANARLLAEAVAGQAKVAEIDMGAVQTNIVIFKLKNNGDAAGFTSALKEKGVLVSAIGPHAVRFVTHYDVDREACTRAAAIVSEQLRGV
jgi:threonine aldolase